MNESEEREYERLKTVDDYFAELEKIDDLRDYYPDDPRVEKIAGLLIGALQKKYKYLVKFSSKFRRKQSLVSRFNDAIKSRREKKTQQNNTAPVEAKLDDLEQTVNAMRAILGNPSRETSLGQPHEVELIEDSKNPNDDEPIKF